MESSENSKFISDIHRTLTNLHIETKFSVIWDIGSRDGLDGISLGEKFQSSEVHCFEPNPNSFPTVRRNCSTAGDQFTAHELALGDKNGKSNFHKINTQLTETTWKDGNPGASSILRPSSKYDVERYVTEEIEVTISKAQSLIESSNFSIPQLLWIDVQGSELDVLTGFGKYLTEVSVIIVELSVFEIYEEQPLAIDVLNFLSEDFTLVKISNLGDYQCDVVFINKQKYRSVYASALNFYGHLVLRYQPMRYMAIRMRLKDKFKRLVKSVLSLTDQLIQRRRSRKHKVTTHNLVERLWRRRHSTPPVLIRHVFERLLSPNPLSETSVLPNVDLVIVSHQKDFEAVSVSLDHPHLISTNQIAHTYLIVPDNQISMATDRFPTTVVLPESDLLSKSEVHGIEKFATLGRTNWALQQLLKIRFCSVNDSKYSLIQDADTISISPRVWIDHLDKQILLASHEYHLPYEMHASACFKFNQVTPLSFVTHQQLFKKEVIESMFGVNSLELHTWIALSNPNLISGMSEYHSYGAWLFHNDPSGFKLAGWSNRSIDQKVFKQYFQSKNGVPTMMQNYRGYSSISVHQTENDS